MHIIICFQIVTISTSKNVAHTRNKSSITIQDLLWCVYKHTIHARTLLQAIQIIVSYGVRTRDPSAVHQMAQSLRQTYRRKICRRVAVDEFKYTIFQTNNTQVMRRVLHRALCFYAILQASRTQDNKFVQELAASQLAKCA